ncbi:MAG: choice-of-anchor J domain-containing protein [Bacteroidaceae bacterium]|nr:choice-of-anchor J domain-containing protein [Bacteroidaceae bacterium]
MKLRYLFFAALSVFAFAACTETPESPYNPGGNTGGNGNGTPEGVYINETFASSFGVFSTEETVGNYPWVIDYSTAKATSYDSNTQANNAATSWLISSPVDFTNETEAYVAFEYIIRYSESGKVAANHQLLISNNYAGNAAEATWVDLPYNAVEGSDWATFYKANVAVPAEFLGKSGVVFALRYTATIKAGTWEVKNFKVAHGKAEVTEPEEAEEYTVAQALAAYSGAAKPAIVKGYIVGSIDDKSIDDANFSGNAVLKTNLLIADNADETDIAKCLAVQLPSGKVRDALNLVDNPDNYKKFVTLTGSLEKYFGVAGLKSISAYSIDGVTPEEPETPETPANAYISEAFTNGFGSFTTQETVGDFAWVSDATYGAKASGYANGASQDAESWLISSAIDFTNETAAYISFDYVINKGDAGAAAANHKLVITSNYTGDVATTEWTEVNYGAVNNGDWTFHNTGKIALPESMMGQTAVVIAFKYMSTTANSSTWEIKNVEVASGTGATPEQPETPKPEEPETPETPETPVIPTEGNVLENGDFEEWSGSTPTGWGKDGSNATAHSATISQSTDAHTGSYAVNVSGYSGGNKRLASKAYTLPAGTYTIAAYIKQSGSTAGAFRLGYGIIKDGKIENSDYKYLTDPTTVTNEWELHAAEFTLEKETVITALVMNSKVGNGAAILVDDVTITAN